MKASKLRSLKKGQSVKLSPSMIEFWNQAAFSLCELNGAIQQKDLINAAIRQMIGLDVKYKAKVIVPGSEYVKVEISLSDKVKDEVWLGAEDMI